MEAVGTLAGGIAHDFNNILSAIFGYSDLALDSTCDREQQERYLGEILKAAERASDLVKHILAFSRKTDPYRKPIIPKYVVKEALNLLRASLPSTIEIQETLTSSAAILGDSTQIHQITMNLCTNAGYAMREKGGVLHIGLKEVEIDADQPRPHSEIDPGVYLRLQVSDTGTGIPEGIMSRIFDPFFTTKPQGEGTGLGLSAVHGIVKSLDGVLAVSSDEGKGSTFSIYFPVLHSNIRHEEDYAHGPLPRGSERILLVDDEEALIHSSETLLKSLGYQVDAFLESTAAWERLSADLDVYDVVITDLTMPMMTGIELSRKIRGIRPNLPIVICSGYISFSEDIKDLGRIRYLSKPVTIRQLAHTLRDILDEAFRHEVQEHS